MRFRTAQDVHDRLIESVATLLTDKHPGWFVYTNPGAEKNLAVDGQWPDLVLVDDQRTVRAVYEVETGDTVDLGHAAQQWVAFSALGKPFFLVVPEERAAQTRQLARELGVTVRGILLY